MSRDFTLPTREPDTQATVDVAAMLGVWKNVNADVDFISRLHITTPAVGALTLQLFDATTVRGELFGETEALACTSPQSSGAVGFYSSFKIAGNKITITANKKLGTLVLQCYTEFQDGSDRQNLLTREFYRRDPDCDGFGATDKAPPMRGVFKPKPRRDFSFLRGRWINTHADTRWVTDITISNVTGWSVEMSLRDRAQLQQVPIVPFVFDSSEFGFTAHSESDRGVSAYAAFSNKGLIVMAGFHQLEENGRRQNFMSREFYYKQV